MKAKKGRNGVDHYNGKMFYFCRVCGELQLETQRNADQLKIANKKQLDAEFKAASAAALVRVKERSERA